MQENFKFFTDTIIKRHIGIKWNSADKICLVILKEKEYKFRIGSGFHIIFLLKEFQLICILKGS